MKTLLEALPHLLMRSPERNLQGTRHFLMLAVFLYLYFCDRVVGQVVLVSVLGEGG